MGEINNKTLEKAIAVMMKPWIYDLKETPMLASLEIIDRVKEICLLGFEDSQRQKDGDSIIKQAQE